MTRAATLAGVLLVLLAGSARAEDKDVRMFDSPPHPQDPRLIEVEEAADRLFAQGDARGALASAEEGLSLARKDGRPAVLAFELSKAGVFHREAGDRQTALKRFEEARGLDRVLVVNTWVVNGDNVAELYRAIADLYRRLGRKKDAQACDDEWKAIEEERKGLISGKSEIQPESEQVSTGFPEGKSPVDRAYAAEAAGEFDQAAELFGVAASATEDATRAATLLRRQGSALGRSGRSREAAAKLIQAAERFTVLGRLADEADCLDKASVQEKRAGSYASAAVHSGKALMLGAGVAKAKREVDAALREALKARSEERFVDALQAFRREEQAAAAADLPDAQIGALTGAVEAAMRLRKFQEGLGFAERAVRLSEGGSSRGAALKAKADALKGVVRFADAIQVYQAAWRDALKRSDLEQETLVLWGMGSAWSALADGRRMVLCYNRAIRLATKLGNANSVDAMRMLLAMTIEQLNEPDLTEQVWKARLASARDSKYAPGIADSLRRLGDVANDRGQYAKALASYREALELERKTGNRLNESLVLLCLGNTEKGAGDPSAAVKSLEEALALTRSQAAARVNEVPALTLLSLAYTYLGDFPGALRYSDEALQAARRIKDHGKIADAENGLAILYDEIGDYDASLEHGRVALAEAEAAKDTSQMISVLGNIGAAYLDMGDWKNAVAYNQRILTLNPWGGGVVNLGYSYFDGKQYDKAEELFRQVGQKLGLARVALARKDFIKARAGFSSIKEEGEKEGNYSYLLAIYSGIGLSQEGLGHHAEAAESFRKGQALLERVRDGLSELERMHFLATQDWSFPRLTPHEGMVRMLPFLPAGLRGSLYAAEFTRARVFAEAAGRLYGKPQTRLPTELARRELELTNTIAAAQRRSNAAFRTNDKPGRAEAEKELAKLKAAQSVLIAELRRVFPEYASALYPSPVHVEEVPLAPDEALLEFEVMEPYTKVFLVRQGKIVASYDVAQSRDELSELVRKYRGFFEGARGDADLAAFDPRLGFKLYQLLLAPALKLISPGTKITVVPDEILGILPFESLVSRLPSRLEAPAGRHGPAPVGVRYVADDFDIAYAQSATALAELRALKKRGLPAKEAFVLADPIFNPADSRLRGTPLASAKLAPDVIRTMGAAGRTMGLGGSRTGTAEAKVVAGDDFVFPRLDKTGALAERLRAIFAAERTDELVGPQASESELAKQDLSRYRNLVFATHGILDGTVSGIGEPALVLNQLGNEPPADGFLTISKIMALRLNADVVALTACQTGLGKRLTGEGVMGLGRAFQYAGARNVLVSLWNVAEDSTTSFAESFFRHLHEGKSKRQALRLARAELRKDGYEHPFYWAPFILYAE